MSTGEPGVAGTARRVGVYYAWSRPTERTAPLGVIENRFPALFESRRILYPRLADPDRFDQGIGGFLEHILRRNFADFVEGTRVATGTPVLEAERAAGDGMHTPLTREVVSGLDTLRAGPRPAGCETVHNPADRSTRAGSRIPWPEKPGRGTRRMLSGR